MAKKTVPQYEREDLKRILVRITKFLGYALDDPDKPLRVDKNENDAQLQATTVEACKALDAAGWKGKDKKKRDITQLDDLALNFLFETGVLNVPAPVDDEELLDEEDIAPATDSGEEDLTDDDEDDVPAPAPRAVQADDDEDIDALERQVKLAEAGVDDDEEDIPAPAPKTAAKGKAAPAPAVDDDEDIDPKTRAMAQEQGSTAADVRSRYAPVTVNNIEAAVITMADLLKAGKVVCISAHDITDAALRHVVPAVPAAAPAEAAAPAPKPAAAAKGKAAAPVEEEEEAAPAPAAKPAAKKGKEPRNAAGQTLEEFVAERVQIAKDKIVNRLQGKDGDLRTEEIRREFCAQNSIQPSAGSRASDLNSMSLKQLGIAVRQWAEARAARAAEKKWRTETGIAAS